jgi:protein tyrosine phosphatase (PTP) superfamily phosphohydrolase (DUF442 family)
VNPLIPGFPAFLKEGEAVRVSNPIRTAALAAFIAVTMSAPVLARGAVDDRLATITIENFGQVNDAYYRGAQPRGGDYEDLKAIGVKTIIDLTDDDGNKGSLATQAGLKFFQIPMSSTSAPSKAQVDQFLGLVNDPANQPVYVHCKARAR